MTQLKGMTWNHERGIAPLIRASQLFKEKTGIEIKWDARSLSDFELFPLEKLADKYDFIMIDHPHIGVAYEKNLLIPLDKYLPSKILDEQQEGTVGKSFASYHWEGHQYAIPLDAAAQVSAYREDLLGNNVPVYWTDVICLAKGLSNSYRIAIPFVPVHAYSSFFSMSSQLSKNEFWTNERNLDLEVGEQVLEQLQEILSLSDQASFDMDPIQVLDCMAKEDQIVYCPLIYGYSNYSRDGYAHAIVKFNNMPMTSERPEGSMIGGVGLSISTSCKPIDEAIKFMEMVINPDFQKTEFFQAGGQPGHIQAWIDKNVNQNSHNFFIDTLDTLKYGSMRPRFSGYIDFQAEAGKRIRECIMQGNKNKRQLVRQLNELMEKCRENRGLN